jgi:hypothetical protein
MAFWPNRAAANPNTKASASNPTNSASSRQDSIT